MTHNWLYITLLACSWYVLSLSALMTGWHRGDYVLLVAGALGASLITLALILLLVTRGTLTPLRAAWIAGGTLAFTAPLTLWSALIGRWVWYGVFGVTSVLVASLTRIAWDELRCGAIRSGDQ